MSQSLMTQPVRLGATRQGDADTRGIDLTIDLSPLSDDIVAITSVTISRRDGNAIGANDLQIPTGYAAPWLTAIQNGLPTTAGFVVNWWQASNAGLLVGGAAVDYQITVVVQTANGRILVRDCYCAVVAGLG